MMRGGGGTNGAYVRVGHARCQTIQELRYGCFVIRFHEERVNENFNGVGTVYWDVAVDFVPTL